MDMHEWGQKMGFKFNQDSSRGARIMRAWQTSMVGLNPKPTRSRCTCSEWKNIMDCFSTCAPPSYTKRLFNFGSDPYRFTGAPLKWRHRLVWPQLTGRDLQRSNYLVNLRSEPAGSEANGTTRWADSPGSQHVWLSSSLSKILKCSVNVSPIFPSKTLPFTWAGKQKHHTVDGGCTKPSAGQMFCTSPIYSRCS